MEPFTLTTAAKLLVDESAAWEKLEQMRWPNGAECPRCGEQVRVKFLAPRAGQRTTRTGKVSHRRLWRCNACKRQFTVLVGTIFEDSRIPVGKWLMAVYLMASAKNGVSAHELHRGLQVSYKTAWFMCHRLREAMAHSPFGQTMRGTIVADETWIGGDPGNRHANRPEPEPVPVQPGAARPNQHTDKAPVVALVNADTGEVRSAVIPNVSVAVLHKAMSEHVDMARSHLVTDEARHYKRLGQEFASHQTVNHSQGEYVRGGISTNRAEGYFAQVKRSLDGTHHHVSVKHLPRYTGEFDFRYSTCKVSDGERATAIVERAEGRRLTYQGLTGRAARPAPGRRPGPLA